MFEQYSIPQLISLYFNGKRAGSGALEEIRETLRIKYEAVPDEGKRYCAGDMDLKDFQIKQIINKEI